MMDITPNSSSVIIAGDKCILFLVLVVTVNLLQINCMQKTAKYGRGNSQYTFHVTSLGETRGLCSW